MSAHAHTSRSDYAKYDAYADQFHQFSVFDTEKGPRPTINYGRGYVTTIESYVIEETRQGRSTYPPSYARESEPRKGYGQPPEVQDLLARILNEVNVPPRSNSNPNPGGSNQGGPYFPPGLPARTSYPRSLGRVEVYKDVYRPVEEDRTRGLPPGARDLSPGKGWYGFPNERGTLDDHSRPDTPTKVEPLDHYGGSRGYGSPPTKNVEPTRDFGYDYNHGSPVKSERAPNDQWGGYGVNPRNPPPQGNYQVSDSQWSNPPLESQKAQNYEVSNNPSSKKPVPPRDHEACRNRGGGSPVKSRAGYERDPTDDLSTVKPENLRGYVESKWGRFPLYLEGQGDDEVASNQWHKSSSNPTYDHPRNKQEPQTSAKYGVPSNQWDRDRLSSPGHGSQPQSNPSGTKNQWGSTPTVKPRSPRDYRAPSNQWERSPSPGYGGQPQSNPSGTTTVKPQSPREYIAPSNQWDRPSSHGYGDQPQSNPSGPKKQWDSSPPVKPQSPRDYRAHSNQWERSSSPVHGQPQNNPSGTKNQWGSTPTVTPQSPRDYRVPSNQQGGSSSPLYDHPRNKPSTLRNQWEAPPEKTQSPRGYDHPSDHWDRPSSPVQRSDGYYKPPQVTCKDGVCKLSDRPKAPQVAYDEPNGSRNNFPVSKPVNYPDNQYDRGGSWRPNPNNPSQQPGNYGRNTSQMNPSDDYVIGEALEPLDLDDRSGRSSALPRKIDGREAAGIYGGHNVSGKKTPGGENQGKTITSKEAVQKYNGAYVPK